VAGAVVVRVGWVVNTVGPRRWLLVVGVARGWRWDALGCSHWHEAGEVGGGGHDKAYPSKESR